MNDANGPTDPVTLIHQLSPLALALVQLDDGLLLNANPACLQILGITAQQVADGFTVDAIRDARDQAVASVHPDGSVSEIELMIDHPKRGQRFALAALVPVDVSGRPCVVATLIDITGRRQLRRELEESRAQMDAFLDHAPAVILLKDVEGHYLWGNRLAGEEFGISKGPSGATAFDLLPHDLAEEMTRLDQRAIAEDGVVRAQLTVPSRSGDSRELDLLKFPVRDSEGVVHAIGTIGSDVTDEHRILRDLRESEERFRQLAGNVDEVFVLWAADPVEVLYVTPAVERVFGLAPDEYSMDRLLEMVHPDDRGALGPGTSGEVRTESPRTSEFRIVRPDGQERWIRTRTAAIESPDSVRTRWTSTLTDITEQVLSDRRLAAAVAEAEQANRAKSEFLSRMSHELRTPLNAVLGFAQLLQADRLESPRSGYVDQIMTAGRHLLGLVDEVLDISRIEGGFLRLSLEPVAADELLQEAVDLVLPSATAVGVSIRIEAGEAGVHVRADHLRLRQVVLNLLSNAIKYNASGGEVVVSYARTQRSLIRISVSDNGPGISAAGVAKLFAPFERLEASATAVQGTGLGLVLARELTELMGGSIGVDSELGRGSHFWVDLAEIDGQIASLPAYEPPPAAIATDGAGSTDRHPSTVLVIEDNPSNIHLIEQILARRPQTTLLVATTGEHGLETLGQGHVDLVLLDLHLPDMRGEDVLARINADARMSRVPVVILTADATDGQRDSTLALGAVDHLTKPFDIARFLAVIDRHAVSDGRRPRVLQVEDDDLNRTFMGRLFDRDLPDVELTSVRTGREALESVRLAEPDLMLLDLHLPDMLGTDLLSALDEEGLMRDRPKLMLSGDLRPRTWVDGPTLCFMSKPFNLEELVGQVKTFLGRDD